MTDDWEGGERQGIHWRRAGLVLLAMAVVAAGVYVVRRDRGIAVETDGAPVADASESVDVVVIAPSRAGERWYCPDTYPVRVHDDGRYYPGEYPRGYDLVGRPQSCYVDTERATSDGYQLADPPPDTVLAGGVYLERPSSPGEGACQELAYSSTFDVPCPGLLPTPAIAASCLQDSCTYGGRRDRYGQVAGNFGVIIEQREFREPPGWPDVSPHVVVAAVGITNVDRNGAITVMSHPELVACAASDVVEATRQPTVVDCPPAASWVPRIQGNPHEGHTAAFWRRGDAVYAASVEGHGPDVREVLDVIVEGIRYVNG